MSDDSIRGSDFLKALSRAGEQDLVAVDRRLVELQNELEALKVARRILVARLGKSQPKNSATGKKLADLVYKTVAEHGPNTHEEIARKLTSQGRITSPQAVLVCVSRSGWFTRDDGKVYISTSDGAAS